MSFAHDHEDQDDRSSRLPNRTPLSSPLAKGGKRGVGWPGWLRSWMLTCTLTSGLFALLWLLLRSGPKPSRLAYPCQQAAFGLAAAAFGAPLVATVLSLRRHLIAALRTTSGKIAGGALGAGVLVVLAAGSVDPLADVTIMTPPDNHGPDIFLVNNVRGIAPGRFGGVDDLITLMGTSGFKWHRSSTSGLTSGPDGLIDADDVVLIKINGQWSERGGTNTDVLRGVIRRVVEHPDGFLGEIIVADNTQSYSNLDLSENNAEDHGQSNQDVVNDFLAEGWNISTYLWDILRGTSVAEYSDGDMISGYIVNPDLDPQTRIKVSYPKFQSALDTYVSYKHGIWLPSLPPSGGYDADKLVVINIPVFKVHQAYGITASVKNHMGVVTTDPFTDSHSGVGRGGLGSVLAEVRMPDLTILDCIWIHAHPEPTHGPGCSYDHASRRDQLVASVDPVALDMWATKFIMVPQAIEEGYTYEEYGDRVDPDNPDSKFRRYLDLTMNEMLLAGIPTTNDLSAVSLHVWAGDMDSDGDVDMIDLGEVTSCVTGPGGDLLPACEFVDSDQDTDVDLADIAAFQRTFTGPF